MPDSTLNIIIEENVPFVRGLLDPYANIRYLAPEEFTPGSVADADAMIIRTRTRCDRALLEKSRCRFIATATIGMDHIDIPYCTSRGITVANAPGCNAPAVAQYVFASILAVVTRPLAGLTIGIVGVGHVGSIVENWAHSLGMNVMRCDPPRQRNEGGDWATLQEIAADADIITFHTPLTHGGPDATFHLADSAFFNALRHKPVIINSARGPVTDTRALIPAAENGQTGPLIIDCWENEPEIDRTLLKIAAVATPHIAGYSIQGKIRASRQALEAVCSAFGLPHVAPDQPEPPAAPHTVSIGNIRASYDPLTDTNALRTAPEMFESLRNHYRLRNEVTDR